jgi:hypothetical protein
VTVEAFFPARFEVLGTVGVAVDAGKSAHTLTMHDLVRVTLGAELFRGKEAMETRFVRLHVTVTFSALNLLHVNMLGVKQRFVDPLGLAFRVALVAVFFTDNDFTMPLRNDVRPVQYKADQQVVHLRDREMMAIMTVEIFVLALGPRVEGRLHEMTANAEFGVILGKIVEPVRYITAAGNDEGYKSYDEKFCF